MMTYTLHTTDVSGDHVIARGLTAVDAMDHIIACTDKLDYQVCVEGYEDFCRYWAIFRGGSGGETVLQTSVPTTDSADADKSAAMDLIAMQFRSIAHEYWDGRWDTDQTYDEMLRYPADRADADRMEREIASSFFDALADDGYVIARDSIGNEFKLDQAVDRAELLEHVNENWVGDLTVSKTGTAQRFRFNFGGDGWNIIQDLSGRLGPMIHAIIDPHRSKGHPVKISSPAGPDPIVLRSPDDAMTILNYMSKLFG